jgi:DNA-binding transcriptional LysR family regulator
MLKVSDFDFRQLRVFKSVVDCGGFSAAESALNMNLPAISGHMSDLEARVGMRLCERGRGGFGLTEAGRQLYASAEKMLTSVENFRADISLIQGQISGRLAIGTVDNTVTNPDARIALALQAVKRRDADFRITLEIEPANQIEESVQKGRLDVGIGPFRSTSANLVCQPLYVESLLLYCGRGHPLFASARQRIDVEAVGSLDYVARGYLREAKEVPDVGNFRTAAVAFNMEAVAMLVLSGRLVGFLPDHYAAQWVGRDELRALRPDVFHQQVEFSCITRRDQKPSPGLDWFLQALRDDA